MVSDRGVDSRELTPMARAKCYGAPGTTSLFAAFRYRRAVLSCHRHRAWEPTARPTVPADSTST